MPVRLGLSHDLHFRFQFDPAFGLRRSLDPIDQFEHLGRGRAAIVHDKIAVHFRNARFSDGGIFQAQFIDQFPGRTFVRVFENAAGTLCNRLSGPPFFLGFMETRLDLFSGCGRSTERG